MSDSAIIASATSQETVEHPDLSEPPKLFPETSQWLFRELSETSQRLLRDLPETYLPETPRDFPETFHRPPRDLSRAAGEPRDVIVAEAHPRDLAESSQRHPRDFPEPFPESSQMIPADAG